MDKIKYIKTKFIFICVVLALSLPIIFAACSLEGDIEAFRRRPVDSVPQAPAVPSVSIGNGEITVNWTEVAGATSYEIWLGTSSNPALAAKNGADESVSLSRTIKNLANGTAHYVWIKAKNSIGTSGFSPMASGIPSVFTVVPQAPAVPAVSIGNGQITVNWTEVANAISYEIWFGTSSNPAFAAKNGADESTSLSRIINGLTNGTAYYVWIKAKNSIGTSGFSPMASGTPSGTPSLSSGLYKGDVKIGDFNISTSLSYISTNAVTGDKYYIVLGTNESLSPMTLNYSGKSVEIVLQGYGSERTVTLNANGSMFTVNAGVTFTIDSNIKLVGRNTNNASLIQVNTNGTLTMNGGTISGNTGSGVNVSGTFTMNGGIISENIARGGGVFVSGGTFNMYGGIINGNTSESQGGGIEVGSGTFNMYGGTINGNTANNYGGGVFMSGGTFTMYGGEIFGNTAGFYGGGMYLSGSNTIFRIVTGTVYGSNAPETLKNTAGSRNAALYYVVSISERGTFNGATWNKKNDLYPDDNTIRVKNGDLW